MSTVISSLVEEGFFVDLILVWFSFSLNLEIVTQI